MVVQEPEAATLEQENRAILAVMVGQAEKAPEPGTMKMKDVVNAGNEENPTPMEVQSLTSAGYRYMYDTETGMRSLTNLNMLPAQLRKQRENRTPVYTIVKPSVAPRQGTQKCLLHKDNPDRARYEEWGFRECPKANLPSAFMVERHMLRRHPAEWATIQQERTKKRDDERWALERAILQQAAARTTPVPVEVPKETVQAEAAAKAIPAEAADKATKATRWPRVSVRAPAEGETNG